MGRGLLRATGDRVWVLMASMEIGCISNRGKMRFLRRNFIAIIAQLVKLG